MEETINGFTYNFDYGLFVNVMLNMLMVFGGWRLILSSREHPNFRSLSNTVWVAQRLKEQWYNDPSCLEKIQEERINIKFARSLIFRKGLLLVVGIIGASFPAWAYGLLLLTQ